MSFYTELYAQVTRRELCTMTMKHVSTTQGAVHKPPRRVAYTSRHYRRNKSDPLANGLIVTVHLFNEVHSG